MDFKLELVLVPVTDVDRTKAFYLEHLGFDLLVDTPVGEMRIVQVTPPGSACSIGFGTGLMDGTQPGTYRGMHLVVADIVAARAQLIERGVQVSDVRHMIDGAWHSGPDPNRSDYMSFADFSDPDGNGWVLQEVGHSGATT
ncbi:MAG TPA: VOC family protein [Jatrophihabitantaceae bacterium]|nr:VOC family protein [Jatrophihabitantaceae bacterium]